MAIYIRQNKLSVKNCTQKQRSFCVCVCVYSDKWLIQWEDITNKDIYAPNIRAPKQIKQLLTDLKGEIKSNTTRIAIQESNTMIFHVQ